MKFSRRPIIFLAASCLAILGVGVIGYGLVAEPRTPLGHALFHAGYLPSPTRPAFLSFYQWALRTGEGGYLPSAVDEFLTDRLTDCKGTKEFDAIVDFQIRQGSGLWGEAPSRSYEALRIEIIDSVMRRLAKMSEGEALSAMEFVESLRRGTPLHKGGFSGMYAWDDSGKNLVLKREQFSLARDSFISWWQSSYDPKTKLTRNPLEGTQLAIHDGP